MHSSFGLIWLALVLFIAWVVLRMGLALAAGLVHLLWLAAMISIAAWIFQQTRGRGSPPA